MDLNDKSFSKVGPNISTRCKCEATMSEKKRNAKLRTTTPNTPSFSSFDYKKENKNKREE